MSPYEILGLNEDESDERTIKRAYAKLLKQHRPDQDPEGFKRVHAAYQSVMQWRAYLAPEATMSPVPGADAVAEPVTTPSPSVAPALSVPDVPPATRDDPAKNVSSPIPAVPTPSVPDVPPATRDDPAKNVSSPISARPAAVPPATVEDRSRWQAAVAAVESAAVSPPSPTADAAVKQTLAKLLQAVDSGHGSADEWATVAIEAIGQRWEVLSGFLDAPAMDRVLRDRRLEQLHAICKRVALRQGVGAMPRWLAVWLDQREDAGALGVDDEPQALRVVAWSALLAPALASRLVALLERSAMSPATIEKADHLLAAGGYHDLLSDGLRRQLVARVVGLLGKKDDSRTLEQLRRALASLANEHPIRRLATTYAGVRVKDAEEEVGCLSALFGWVIILTCLGLVVIVLDLFRRVGVMLGGDQLGVGLAVVVLVLLIWQRKRVLGFLTQHLFAPFTLGVIWMCVWVTFAAGPGVGLSLPVPDDTQRVVSASVTIVLLLGFALIRRSMLQLDREPGGWRLLVPPLIEAAVEHAGAVRQSQQQKQTSLLLGVTWSMAMFFSVLVVEPLGSQPGRMMVALLWLSGPIAFLALAIRAWLLVWLRAPMRSWSEIRFWGVASVLIWVVTYLAPPWLAQVIPIVPWLPPIVVPSVVLVLATGLAALIWYVLRGRVR